MSSNPHLSKRRRTFVRLVGEIQHALNAALEEEHEKRGLTRSQIARALGRDKAFVTRKLAGMSNMTIETLADLAYALNRPVKVSLPSRDAVASGVNSQQAFPNQQAQQSASGIDDDPLQSGPSGFPTAQAAA